MAEGPSRRAREQIAALVVEQPALVRQAAAKARQAAVRADDAMARGDDGQRVAAVRRATARVALGWPISRAMSR